MRRKILIAGGLALLLFTAVWQLALAPQWTQRIRSGWTWETTYIGYQTFVDSQTGKLPEKDVTSLYKYSINIVPGSERADLIELYNNYVIYDVVSRQVIMEFKYSVPVNPKTGEHLNETYLGDYFQFPKNVEKKTYNLRFAYLKGIPIAFEKEVDIENLTTYLFAYKGRGEYTEAYAGTEQFPGIKVEPGQEIKCADDQFIFKTWVEPMTGEIIKIEEECQAGSFIYDIATGKQLAAVDRWSGVTAGDDVVGRAKKARRERARQLWFNYYIPSTLLLAGLLCFGLVLIPGKNKDV